MDRTDDARVWGSDLNRTAAGDAARLRGYPNATRTPEYKTEYRKLTAKREGREYVTRPEARRRKVERGADRIRARFARAQEKAYREIFNLEYLHSAEYLELSAAKAKRQYWANPERSRHLKRIAKYAHPGRIADNARRLRMVQSADGSINETTLARMFDSATECVYCSAPMTSTATKSLDHFIPLVSGGLHSVSNVVICCRACNFSKNRTHPFIWLGADRFTELLNHLRSRAAGDPCSVEYLYPIDQVEAA